uniref:Retroelement n=2 Tax=Oryza sativa subsp. japonica TaxID=39947 RepID=Q10A45_ORYSJ|nr:Putative retroelement [Oryza sativa Japonica Group]ABG65916.1 transposon protein, putative, Mutator sub-class [Oryza sativa Japonica Group]
MSMSIPLNVLEDDKHSIFQGVLVPQESIVDDGSGVNLEIRSSIFVCSGSAVVPAIRSAVVRRSDRWLLRRDRKRKIKVNCVIGKPQEVLGKRTLQGQADRQKRDRRMKKQGDGLMDRLVRVYYGGRVVEPYVGAHVEFEDMSLKTILFPTHPTLDELRSRVKEVLGWTEDNVEIRFYGRYDVGQGHKYILNVIGQLEWEVYFDLKNFVTYYSRRGGGASKSELVREDLEGEGEKKRPLLGNDLWEAGPSKRYCGTDDVDAARVMKRELVQEGLDLSEHLSASVHWSSYGVNPEYPTEVAGQYVNPDDYFYVELSGGHDSVSVEVNRDDVDEEASVEQYDVELAEDSDDDRPFPPLTNNDKLALEECRAFEKVFGRKPDIPEFRDLTHAHGALLDGGINLDQLLEPFQVDGLRKGLEFPSMVALKLWLQEYAIVHHRPYRVVNSAANRRYTIKCENPRCKWKVHATKRSSGTWRISRVGKKHSCATAEGSGSHRQLTSKFIANRLFNAIKLQPTLSASALALYIFEVFQYRVKYGKAWRAREEAMKLIYGEWGEAYVRLPTLLQAIKQRNPSMIYHIDTHPDRVVNVDVVTKKIFMRAFWCFGPSIEAFKHCRPVLAIDATFLTGKYGGALMTALSADAEDQLVPLAFALVEKENSRDWEVCIISDRHAGIMNAMTTPIPGLPPVHHRWCMRHFSANFHKAGADKYQTKELLRICQIDEKWIFERDVEALRQRIPEGPRKWLEDELLDKDKWSRAYDRNGRRWGYMTTNMAEQFNSVLVGVHKLPVTAIVSFTFMKCNDYFVNRHDEALKRVQLGQRWSTKVDSKMKVQKSKANKHTARCFDKQKKTYEVTERGGITRGGVRFGARAFKVEGEGNSCSCQRPLLYHMPCSHLIHVYMIHAIDEESPNRMPYQFSSRAVVNTWASRFEPYLDPTQWPPYDGEEFVADPNLKIKTRGKRRSKRFKNEMDSGLGGSGRKPPSCVQLDAAPVQNDARCVTRRVLQPLRVRAHAPPVFDDRGMPVFNAPALTALVDRWRPETHSFHLPSGEMTITLQDVAMILALPLQGHAVTGRTETPGWHAQMWMWLRLPVGRPKWRQSFTPWPYNEPDMEKTVAYLFESTATAHAHQNVAYKHYVNEMDCLQPQHCPLICFWAVEYHLPHRVMRQFGKKQDWPVEDISTGVELHKYDRVRTKKVKDWGLEHNRYIDEWRTAGRNDRTYRLFLRPTWTEADIEDDRDSDEGRNPYDVRTRVGYQMEHAPLRDRVSRELLRSVNEMGHTLQAPRGGEDTENTLRNVLEKVRQRCRKLAARLGCRSVGLDDVYQPGRLPPPLPQSARPSIARHSIRIEEREGVGGSSSSRIKQGRGKGKAPAPPSDDDDDEDEEDEDYVAPDAEEIDMSQLPDAPQGTQPTQYNLRSTRAAKKREAEGGANHPGAAVGEGGASQCREAEGFRAGGGRRQLPWRRGP